MSRTAFLAAATAIPKTGVAGFLLSLAACAYVPAPPPVRYETAGEEDIWSDGMRLHPARTRPLAFTSGYFEATRRTASSGESYGTPFTFLILAENRSAQPVLLDPMAFRAHLPVEKIDLAPVDPEAAIRAAHKELMDEQGAMVHAQGVEAMVHLPLLLLDLAATPTKTPEEAKADREFWADQRKNAEERDARHRERMRLAGERRDQWSERALRKTTLFPGMRALGTVSFVQDTAAMRPDTLVLRYRGKDSLWLELGRFGRIRDSVEESPVTLSNPFTTYPPGRKPAGRLHPRPAGPFPPLSAGAPLKTPFRAFSAFRGNWPGF